MRIRDSINLKKNNDNEAKIKRKFFNTKSTKIIIKF